MIENGVSTVSILSHAVSPVLKSLVKVAVILPLALDVCEFVKLYAQVPPNPTSSLGGACSVEYESCRAGEAGAGVTSTLLRIIISVLIILLPNPTPHHPRKLQLKEKVIV